MTTTTRKTTKYFIFTFSVEISQIAIDIQMQLLCFFVEQLRHVLRVDCGTSCSSYLQNVLNLNFTIINHNHFHNNPGEEAVPL